MSNFKSQAKRQRELAKLNKRQAKDQKRALRKAERSGATVAAPAAVAQPMPANDRLVPGAAPARTPATLAEAVARWRNTKVAKPNKHPPYRAR